VIEEPRTSYTQWVLQPLKSNNCQSNDINHTHTAAQRFWLGKIFYVFKISLFCSLRLQLFDKKVLLWNIITFKNRCFLCEYIVKCNLFLNLSSLLQSSVSHDPSEITVIWGSDDQDTFMIIISVTPVQKCGVSKIIIIVVVEGNK